ncbi:MAG: hypothetical protein KI790_08250 [Cyclobacteriaceae bacterium]|nr:hypothetical protein [Cyclobacteriaceae bacterium HetDA_MAG_MS6]
MKRLLILIALVTVLACEDTVDGPECPDRASCAEPIELTQESLDSIRLVIINEAQASTCGQDANCLFIGLGSKPCGGPSEYLIYSSSLDTASIHSLVEYYNNLDDQLNEKLGKPSDCSIAPAPDSVVCDNGCVAYRNGKAFRQGVCCN